MINDRRDSSSPQRRRDHTAAVVCVVAAAFVAASIPASNTRAEDDEEGADDPPAESTSDATADDREPSSEDSSEADGSPEDYFPALGDDLEPAPSDDAARDRQDATDPGDDDRETRPDDETLKPGNHSVDWMRRHGQIARSDAQSCAECHSERDCASCHDEKLSDPFSVHPPNFDTLHSIDARARRSDCTDCHTLENFCTDCHTRAEITARPDSSPPPGSEVHPDGWTDPGAANNHGVMARRNITDCVTCHTEDDCVSCHSGVDPHPPEFKLNCSRWLEANPRPCTECHNDLEALRTMCR